MTDKTSGQANLISHQILFALRGSDTTDGDGGDGDGAAFACCTASSASSAADEVGDDETVLYLFHGLFTRVYQREFYRLSKRGTSEMQLSFRDDTAFLRPGREGPDKRLKKH